jgi:hypothetical protein
MDRGIQNEDFPESYSVGKNAEAIANNNSWPALRKRGYNIRRDLVQKSH